MNTKILLNERPHGEPNLGNFKTVKEDIRTPNDGEVLLEVGEEVGKLTDGVHKFNKKKK